MPCMRYDTVSQCRACGMIPSPPTRLDIIKDLYDMLNSELSIQHGHRLEWIVIWLIPGRSPPRRTRWDSSSAGCMHATVIAHVPNWEKVSRAHWDILIIHSGSTVHADRPSFNCCL
eukprot:Polyplicarium_translucidae@DN1529_c0_g1_i1.p2